MKTVLFLVVAMLGFLFVAGCGGSSAMNESTPNVRHITQNEFTNEVMSANGAVVVDFYAPWCGPCWVLAPKLETQASLLAGKVKFVKVNVDESPGLVEKYEIQGIPVMLFFRDGKLADRLVGMPSDVDLKLRLDALAAGK